MASSMKDALDEALNNDAPKKKGHIRGHKQNKEKKEKKPLPSIDTTKEYNGSVKWFDIRKGYGFITDDEGKDHFVHFSGIERGRRFIALDPEDKVTFKLQHSKGGGVQAVDVEIIVDDEDEVEYVDDEDITESYANREDVKHEAAYDNEDLPEGPEVEMHEETAGGIVE